MKTTKNSDYLILFGKHLRELREKKGLSQEALAFEADLSISQISRIERGIVNTSLNQIVSIAIALEIRPADLLDFDAASSTPCED